MISKNSDIQLILILLIAMALPGGFAKAEDMPLFKNVDGWVVRVDTTIDNGCFVYNSWKGGSILRLGVNKTQNNMYLMLGDDDWNSLEVGKEYELSLVLGNKTPWDAPSTAVSLGGETFLWVQIPLGQADIFLDEFMTQQDIQIRYQNKSILHLKLTGSYKAGNALMECQELLNSSVSPDSDPFSSSKDSGGDPFAL